MHHRFAYWGLAPWKRRDWPVNRKHCQDRSCWHVADGTGLLFPVDDKAFAEKIVQEHNDAVAALAQTIAEQADELRRHEEVGAHIAQWMDAHQLAPTEWGNPSEAIKRAIQRREARLPIEPRGIEIQAIKP